MKKNFIVSIAYLLISTVSYAQEMEVRFFEMSAPKNKIHKSLYKTINFLDSREDITKIGIANVGFLKNQPAKLILKMPFLPQLVTILNSLIDSTAKEGELLFQLNQFNFVEISGTRYCYLQARLYSKKNFEYKKLSVLDTTIMITSADIIKPLQKQASEIIASFIANELSANAEETTSYSINDINNMDSIEKKQIPLYNTEKFIDGLYLSYRSLKNQAPDMQCNVETKKDGSISSVHIIDSSGKKVKVKSKNAYAIIHRGKIFIATQYDFYPLEKVNDNFTFTGEINISSSKEDINSAGFALGLTGALLAKAGNRETFIAMIDHINGKFLHQARIIKADELN
jgi:hypothetical protein